MGVAFALNQAACLGRSTGDFDSAFAHAEEALALYGELGVRRQVGMALGSLGLLHGAAGDPERARGRLAEALRIFESTDDAPGTAGCSTTSPAWSSTTGAGAGHPAARALARALGAPAAAAPASWTGFMSPMRPRVAGDADGAARHYEAARASSSSAWRRTRAAGRRGRR